MPQIAKHYGQRNDARPRRSAETGHQVRTHRLALDAKTLAR
jgi:hypothetical protein